MKMPRNENIKVCKRISKSGGLRPSQDGNDPDYIPNPKEIGNLKVMKKTLATTKREKRRTNKHKSKMRAHAGFEMSRYLRPIKAFFTAMGNTSCVTDSTFMREIEGLVGLWFAIKDNNSAPSIMSALFLYARSFTNSSITGLVHNLASQFFEAASFETHSGFEGTPTPSWLKFLQDVRNNWKSAVLSPLFTHFSKLLGLLVTLKLCDASHITWKYNDITIFEPITVIHTTAFDLIDAVLGTVTYFVEGLYYSISEGSMKPLITDISAIKLDEEFVFLKAVWELIKQGNLKYSDYDIDHKEFDRRLEVLIRQLRDLLPQKRNIEHSVLMGKITQLLQIKNDYVSIKISSGVRIAPFVVELFGRSSRGKTTMGDQMMDGLMVSVGKSLDKGLRCTYNAKDPFMSTWTTDKEILILDDFANTKKDFVQTAPTQVLVDVANNQPFYAPKAELESKGKVFVEPTFVVVNTNKKDLDAHIYSNCPYSIQRRCHAVISVSVKKEYQRTNGGLDEDRVWEMQDEEEEIQPFDDIWCFTVEEAVEPKNLMDTAKYAPIKHNGIELKDVDFVTVMQFLCDKSHSHFRNQANILDRMKRRKDVIKRCPGTIKGKQCHQILGCCPLHQRQEPHFGREIVEACGKAKENIVGRICGDLCDWDTLVAGASTTAILKSSQYFSTHFDWMKLLPSSWIENYYVQHALMACGSDVIHRNYFVRSAVMWSLAGTASAFSLKYHDRQTSKCVVLGSLGIACTHQYYMKDIAKENYVRCLVERNDSISDCVRSIRDEYMPRAIAALGVFGCLYGMTQVYQACREMNEPVQDPAKETPPQAAPEVPKEVNVNDLFTVPEDVTIHECTDGKFRGYCESSEVMQTIHFLPPRDDLPQQPMSTHGNLAPTSIRDIEKRDAEKCVWTPVSVRELDIDPKQRTCGFDGLYYNVQKNLVYASLLMPDGQNMMVDCLFLRSNVVLLPSHIFDEVGPEIKAIFYKVNPQTLGGSFTTSLSRMASILIPGTDLCVVYTPHGGSYKNLISYFPREHLPPMEFLMAWRAKDGEIQEFTGKTVPQLVETTDRANITRRFMGGIYKDLSGLTFKGMCGAPMIVKGKFTCIAGFHLGGYTGTNNGCYGTLLQRDIVESIEKLAALEGVLLTGIDTTFSPIDMGKEIYKPMEPHSKSPIRYVTGKSFNYHGQCPGMVSSHTDVKVMITSEAIMDVCGVPNKWGPPKMKPEYFGWQVTADAISNAADPLPHDLLAHCVADFKAPLIEIASRPEWVHTRPLTDHETLNGVNGVKFMDAMKTGTSIGFPLGGPKKPYIIEGETTPDLPLNRRFNDDIMNKIRQCEMLWANGQRANCVANACKKDEVLPIAKEKCRIFYGSPVALVWGVRKYFLPIVRLIQMNPLVSECAVGVNSYSPEWDQMMRHVRSFGDDRIFGGDYKKYDTSLPTQLILAAFRVLIDIARQCQYTESDFVSMGSIAGDVAHSFIAFNGDLISLISNMGISGHALTVILNSICGSLLQRAAFYTNNSFSLPFREHVSLLTYGDDNIGSSSCFVKHDNVTVAKYLKTIKMEYTMPDKSSTMLPFLPDDMIEFLKRKSVYKPEIGCTTGALCEDSIFKSLHCHVHGKKSPITQREAAAINIGIALNEWFHHGPQVYEMRRKQMVEVAQQTNLTHMIDGLHMTYAERVVQWKETYCGDEPKATSTAKFGAQSGYEPKTGRSRCPLAVVFVGLVTIVCCAQSGYEHLYTPIRPVETLNPPPAPPNRHKRGDAVSNLLPMVSKIDLDDWIPVLSDSHDTDVSRLRCGTGKRVKESVDHMAPRKKQQRIGQNFSKIQQYICKDKTGGLVRPPETKDPSWEESEAPSLMFEPHSGDEHVPDVTQVGTVDFHDAPMDYIDDMNPFIDSSRTRGEGGDAPIKDFFGRPVRIAEYLWNVGSPFSQQLNVWAQYFTNPRISNRINNYKLVRCTLHVKVTINGNGFYYGRLLCAYNPLKVGDNFFVDNSSFDLTALSQMPHVFADPTHSLGGELKCPFFYPYDYVDTNDADWYQLGALHLRSMNVLRHANNGTDPISINVFAWAEDMELAIPTMLNTVGLTAQSGNEMEEANSKGYISSKATALAKTAGILSSIPGVRPYALASQMALNAVSGIAKLFGYSRPVITSSNNVVPRTTNALALGNAADTSHKLSLDYLQEITVDPGVAGMKEPDPLNIRYIASHESYLATFTFANTDVIDDLLWNTRVDARLWQEDIVAGNARYAFTSTAFASMPFQYWSGTMKFRFQIVASSFHKGRLAFVWDPSYVKPGGPVEYNTNYIQIIDIAETQDFTLAIPNGTKYGMIKSPKPGLIPASDMYGTTAITTQLKDNETQRDVCNGVLAVYVLNTLTAPDSAAPPIEVNVFVSGGDDFEVHVPDDWYNRFSPLPYEAESGFEPQSGMSPTEHFSYDYNAPQNGDTIYMGYKSGKSSEFNKVYTGEAIVTLRMLAKRFSRWRSFAIVNERWAKFKHGFFPPFLGYYGTGLASSPDTTAAGEKYAFVTPTILHWILPAYKGFRGAMRHKIVPRMQTDNEIYVTRYSDTDGVEWSETTGVNITPASPSGYPRWASTRTVAAPYNDTLVPAMGFGGAMFNSVTNQVAEIELPFYSQRRFAGARHNNWAAVDTYDLGGYVAHVFALFSTNDYVDFFCAAGDDFQCLFYVGLPPMYYFETLPAAL